MLEASKLEQRHHLNGNRTNGTVDSVSYQFESLQMTDHIAMEERFSCPFTWGLKEVLAYHRASAKHNLDDYMFTGIPVTSFVISIIRSFESMEKDEDACAALKYLLEAEIALKQIQKSIKTRDISKAVEHIYLATVVHVVNKSDPTNEIDTRENIIDIKDLNNIERAGLAGCKSFALSLYQLNFLDEAICLARKAVEGNWGNAFWHYLLGHGLRKKRRNFVGYNTAPSPFEAACFTKAAELDPHPFYEIHYLQAMHEVGIHQNTTKWRKTKFAKEQWTKYEKMWQKCDQPTILLKIALGMMRCRHGGDSKIIHSVLDKVDGLSKKNIISYHYRGRLYKFQQELEKACEYLKLAGDMNNWAADYDYVKCMVELKKPSVDIILFLLKMKRKYKDAKGDEQLQIVLMLAIMYFVIWDYKISAELFLKAIEMSPDSVTLRRRYQFSSVIMDSTFDFLRNVILPKIGPTTEADEEFACTIEKLKCHCSKVK